MDSMYRLIRSRRKTLAIYITRDAEVEVRASMNMSMAYIDRFVISKKQWIEKAVSKREQVKASKEVFKLDYGHMLQFRGGQYPIVAGVVRRPCFDGDAFVLPPGLTATEIKKATIGIYTDEAKKYVSGRLEGFCARLGVSPTRVRITGAMTRWGSCSAKKNINISWRLMMASDEAIDYVIVHELAHLRELNHSPRFWALVDGVMPGHRSARAQLKELDEKQATQDWR